MKNILSFILLFVSTLTFAQTGSISGNLTDKEYNNEPLAFANVVIKDSANGTTSDFDGNYTIANLQPGTYTIEVSFVGYETQTETITIAAGENVTKNFNMAASSAALDEIVITTTVKKESEEALLLEQKKAVTIETAIGAQELSKKGASDLAAAVTKTAGISKQGGSESVMVRGLGDRYNITTLNTLPLPSNNADLKNIDLGIFNTDIVENIKISKTFNPLNYGDFGGANINIDSKEHSGKSYLKLNLGGGGNSNTLGVDKFYLQEGPGFSGFYNKTAPNNPTQTSDWGTSWDKQNKSYVYKGSLNLNGGHTFDIGSTGKLNAFFTVGYDNDTNFREGLSRGKVTATGYTRQDFYKESYSFETNTTAMTSLNYKVNSDNKFAFTSMFLNSSEQSHDEYNGFELEFDNEVTDNEAGEGFIQRNTFKQTKLFVNQLSGEHKLYSTDKTENTFNWILGYNIMDNSIPDRMQNTAGVDNREDRTDDYYLISQSPINNHRFFQDLTEKEAAVNIYDKVELKDSNEDVKAIFTLGYSARFKNVDFESQQYEFRLPRADQDKIYGIDINNFDAFFNEDNLNNLYVINALRNQTYSGTQNINAFYGNLQYNFSEKFNLIAGLRSEMINIDIDYLSLQSSAEKNIKSEEIEILPAISGKYSISEKMNLKFGASKTYTLPQFKERVDMLYEEVTQVYRGNEDVYASTDYNADIKFEFFPQESGLVAVTAFTKIIQNPINSIFINSASNDISYINTGEKANVLGLEIETKATLLDFGSEELKNEISGGLNLSFIDTKQDLSKEKVKEETEFTASFTYDESKLTGASDVLINGDLSYLKEFNKDFKIQSTIAYNYFSDQLNTIGNLGKGNVVDKGFQTLDFIIKGEYKNISYGISAKNILNPFITRVQEIDLDADGNIEDEVILNQYKKGVDFGLSIGYKF